MSGCSRIRSTATLSPWTTLNTPSGRPASLSSSAMSIDAPGSFSLGLRTNVLPQAMALANIHIGTIAGKLNGVIPATTPSGWWIENTSTPVETCSLKPPFSRCGTPHENSTFSIPRATSPRASATTLPCSAVSSAASSLRCPSRSCRIRNMISERRAREVARQAGNAAFAAATARSTSAGSAKSTAWVRRPVAGLNTGPSRPEPPATSRPSIQWLILGRASEAAAPLVRGSAIWVIGDLLVAVDRSPRIRRRARGRRRARLRQRAGHRRRAAFEPWAEQDLEIRVWRVDGLRVWWDPWPRAWPVDGSRAWPDPWPRAWPVDGSRAWPDPWPRAWPVDGSRAWPDPPRRAWPVDGSRAWPDRRRRAGRDPWPRAWPVDGSRAWPDP